MGKIGTGKMRREIENNDCVEERESERKNGRENKLRDNCTVGPWGWP